MHYTTRIQVRFGDVDKAGIVYYPVIFHYLHVAQEDFFAEYVGVPYHRLIEEERLGFPAVTDSTEFYRPFRYGEVVVIEVHISRVGESSVTFEFRLFVEGSDELRARSSQVKVAVDMETWQRVRVPEKYRAIFRECSG
ncbi:MAG TPA: thioesterase family protein [Blastocatellia bacterium]|jgi:4-hydroxybenzoyl-CoA thioesterase|nr:thioesterase family protein [Blastocatellia bacterium]